MRENKLKTLWSSDQAAVNGWLSIANSFCAEVVASAGYDSITVDMQHGIVDYAASVGMMQAIEASGAVPVVRVPWLDEAHVMKALDAGAYGIICPMINTREQAERLVSFMRYPPDGNRSFGPARALFSAGDRYFQEANSQLVCLAMVETAEAMENLDAIVSTPGLDGVYIGPSDLSIGLSNGSLAPGMDREEPEIVEAIHKILNAAHGAGIKACLHTGSASYAAKAVDWGFDLVTLTNDIRLLAAAASEQVEQTRSLIARGDGAGA